MKTIVTCANKMSLPVGAEPTENAEDYGCDACEYILRNKIHRCNKFVGVEGTNPQTGETLKDEFKCADTWVPILLVHVAGTNRGQTVALESFRNEMVKSNTQMSQALAMGADAIKNQPRLRSAPTGVTPNGMPLAPGRLPENNDTTLLDK